MSGASVAAVARSVRWYVTSLMGDRAYENYVTHLRTVHEDAEVPTEREFWAERYREQGSRPGARCC